MSDHYMYFLYYCSIQGGLKATYISPTPPTLTLTKTLTVLLRHIFSFCSWQCTLVTLLFFNYTNLKFLQEGAKSNKKSPSRIFNIIYTILTHIFVNIGLSKIEPLCFSSFAISLIVLEDSRIPAMGNTANGDRLCTPKM